MITLAQLTGANRRTYQRILHVPAVTALRRERVRSLLESVAQVTEGADARLHINRNGHVLMLPAAAATESETPGGLIALRRFLKRSELPPPDSNGREAHLLVVIGQHQARVFRSFFDGGCPEQLMPVKSAHRIRNLDSEGDLAAGPETAFERIAEVLRATGTILVFGESSASQKEMDRFVEWLKRRHADLAGRIIGSLVLNHNQVSPGLVLAKARAFHAQGRSG